MKDAENLKHGAALKIHDHSELAQKYLSEGARCDMAKKATQTIVVKDDGQIYQAVYFCTKVSQNNAERAIEALSGVLNELSQEGLIHSTLAPISSLELAIMSFQIPARVVFAFVLVPGEQVSNLKERFHFWSVEEGGVGNDFDDMTIPLAEGEFQTEIRVQPNFMLQQGQPTPEEQLDKEIERYLGILPQGTVVRQVRKTAVSDLSLPHEVTFYHPLMRDIKRVELQHVRTFSRIDDHSPRIQEFSLTTGIHYFGKDGKRLFDHQY